MVQDLSMVMLSPPLKNTDSSLSCSSQDNVRVKSRIRKHHNVLLIKNITKPKIELGNSMFALHTYNHGCILKTHPPNYYFNPVKK